MELRSGRRLRSCQSQQLGGGSGSGGEDLISSLPDDLLLLALARLPCCSAAARTSVLSRRWYGLWTRLRRIVLHDVPFNSLKLALARTSAPARALEVHIPDNKHGRSAPATGVNSLLRVAARLEPEELVITLPSGHPRYVSKDVNLPCLRHTTSVALETLYFVRAPVAQGEFAVLETLQLSCPMVDLDGLLPLCPRLRVLRLNLDIIGVDGTSTRIHSPLLQELVLETKTVWTHGINIFAPVLKKLTVYIHAWEEAGITIVAPMVEKLSWYCISIKGVTGFGFWHLQKLMLQMDVEVPFLRIHAHISSPFFPFEAANLTHEIEKHIVASFSLLELHLTTKGHVFGALVFHILGMSRICSAMQKLKVVLWRTKVEEGCPPDCPCEPTNWSSQTISLIALEEVEIICLVGQDHEFSFIRYILRCSPKLNKMTIWIGKHECQKIMDISREYPSVKYDVHLNPGFNHGRNLAAGL